MANSIPLMSYEDFMAQNQAPNAEYTPSFFGNGTTATLPTKNLADYLDYAIPGSVTDAERKQYDLMAGPGSNDRQFTSFYDSMPTLQQDFRSRTDLPPQVLDALYNPMDAIRHSNDPIVQQLNAQYKYQPESYGTVHGMDDPGDIQGIGGAGSWDLGNGMTLIPKNTGYFAGYGKPLQQDPSNTLDGTAGFLNFIQSGTPNPYRPDGSFDPSGWRVANLDKESKSAGIANMVGIAGVLAAPLMAYWAPELTGATSVGGAGADIPAGSEGMMIGAPGTTATAPTVTGGMFGSSSPVTSSSPTNPAITQAGESLAGQAVNTGGDQIVGSYGLDSLPGSVNSADAAFGTGGGTTAVDAATAAGSPGAGIYGGMAGVGGVPVADTAYDAAAALNSGAGPSSGATSGNSTTGQLGQLAKLGAGLLAAEQQAGSIRDAAKTNADAAAKAGQQQLAMYNQQVALQAPWMKAGEGALNQLVTGTQPGGDLVKPFSTTDMTNVMPAYTFAHDQALAAMQNQMARGGQNLSSNAIQGAGTLASGLAGQFENQAFNQYQTQQNAEANKLQSLAGIGQTAVGQTNANMTNAGNNQAAATVGAGNAIAGGQLGSGSTYAAAIPSTINTLASILGSSNWSF